MSDSELQKLRYNYKEVLEAVDRLVARNQQLEAALREIKDQYLTPDQSSAIARKALAPRREENSDVGPGFRGNNDNA